MGENQKKDMGIFPRKLNHIQNLVRGKLWFVSNSDLVDEIK